MEGMPTTPSQNSLVDRPRPGHHLPCGWYPPPAHPPPRPLYGSPSFPVPPRVCQCIPRGGHPPVYCFFSACVGVNRGGWWTSGAANACTAPLPKRPPPSRWGTQAALCHGRPPHRPAPHTPIHPVRRTGVAVPSSPLPSTVPPAFLYSSPARHNLSPFSSFLFCPSPCRARSHPVCSVWSSPPTDSARGSGPKGVCCSPITVRSTAAPPVPCLSRARWLAAPGYTPPSPPPPPPSPWRDRVRWPPACPCWRAASMTWRTHPRGERAPRPPPPSSQQHPSVMISRRVLSLIPA